MKKFFSSPVFFFKRNCQRQTLYAEVLHTKMRPEVKTEMIGSDSPPSYVYTEKRIPTIFQGRESIRYFWLASLLETTFLIVEKHSVNIRGA
jgi:hypothetical protein